MEHGGDDPYDSIIPLCYLSHSQEDRLRRCPFAPEPYNPENDASSSSEEDSSGGGGIPIASTPIRMVSLSDSGDEDQEERENAAAAATDIREDEFHTPPEDAAVSSSGEFRPAADVFGYDSGVESVATVATVDLRRDSDLGFRGESPNLEAIRLSSEIEANRMANLDSNLCDFEANRPNSNPEVVQHENDSNNPFDLGIGLSQRENLDSGPIQPNPEALRVLSSEIIESPPKKLKISEPSAELQSSEASLSMTRGKTKEVSESRDDDHQGRLSTKDFVDAMNSGDGTEKTEAVELRRLPSSITGRSENVEDGDKSRGEVTIFDVLNLLAKDCDDGEAPSCSFVEIYKRRGMTFPKPAWWPENLAGFD